MAESEQWLTYAEAAKRVQSSDRTVRRWRREGMPMKWAVDEAGQRYRVVDLDVLLAWWRKTMQSSPVHFYRMRRAIIEAGGTPPEIPERFRQTRKAPATPRSSTSTVELETEPADLVPEAPERRIDPLADMKPLRGADEFWHLKEKLKDATPSCAGIAEFTADKVDAETAAMMSDICAHCPLFARCEAFAIAGRPAAGMWAGKTAAQIRRGKNRAEVA